MYKNNNNNKKLVLIEENRNTFFGQDKFFSKNAMPFKKISLIYGYRVFIYLFI